MLLYSQKNELTEDYIKSKISEFLSEDIPTEDFTTLGTVSESKKVKAFLRSKQNMFFAGEKILKHFFDDKFEVIIIKKDGEFVEKGETIAEFIGSAPEILAKERVLLNLLQRLSGIASLTAEYVKIAKPNNVQILDTRKTTPGLRLFEKYAVQCGGGSNHRLDLSSGILIKDNHIEAAGGIRNAIDSIKKLNINLPIELEVDTKDQLMEALDHGINGFLLDNMTPQQCKECVQLIRGSHGGYKVFVEASGGITLKTLEGYMQTGIDAVSVGAITHSVKAIDMHLEFTALQ